MKFSLKACLACLSLAFFGAAIGMFALSFLDQVTSSILGGGKGSWATGFEIAFGQTDLDGGNILGTLFAFIFVALGALAACYGLFVALTAKKGKKGKKNANLLCALCTLVVCGVVPAVLLFLTKQTTAVGLDINAGALGKTETTLGIGAILAAIFSLAGAGSLAVAELSK